MMMAMMQAGDHDDHMSTATAVAIKQEADDGAKHDVKYWETEFPSETGSAADEQAEWPLPDVKLEPKDEATDEMQVPFRASDVELAQDAASYPEDLKETLDLLDDKIAVLQSFQHSINLDPVVCVDQWRCGACASCFPCPEWLSAHHQFDCREHHRDPIKTEGETGSYDTQPTSSSVKNETTTPATGDKKVASKTRRRSSTVKPKTTKPKEGKKFKCSQCPYSTNYRSNYDDHRAIHTNILRYECKVCQKLFKCSAHRRRHMRSTHGPRTSYICKGCGRQCRDRRGATRCELNHTNIRPYKCDKCSKGFIEKGDLARHMVTHTKEKRYSCPTCGKRFAFSHKVTRHQVVHSNMKPFCCGKCNKAYKTSVSLETHLLTCNIEFPLKKYQESTGRQSQKKQREY